MGNILFLYYESEHEKIHTGKKNKHEKAMLLDCIDNPSFTAFKNVHIACCLTVANTKIDAHLKLHHDA